MEPVVYQPMISGEEPAVCALVGQVFNEFVEPDYEQEGVDAFFRFANPEAMAERLHAGGFVLVARQAGTLVGMLEFVLPDHIAMLFVALRQHGVARELLRRAIGEARSRNPSLSRVTVHSSPYADAVYRKMGFRRSGDVTTRNGIRYLPMELVVEQGSASVDQDNE